MTLNDRVLGIFAIVLAAFMAYHGYGMNSEFSYEPIGPKVFPLLLSGFLALCGVILIIKGGNPVPRNPKGSSVRIISMIAILFFYAFAFQPLGFLISTLIMGTLVGKLFGGNWLHSLFGGIGMSIVLYLLFDLTLDVVLPTGLLEGLI